MKLSFEFIIFIATLGALAFVTSGATYFFLASLFFLNCVNYFFLGIKSGSKVISEFNLND